MAYKTILTFHAAEQPVSVLDPVIELSRTAGAHLDIVVLGVMTTPPIIAYDMAPAADWAQYNNDIVQNTVKCAEDIERYTANAEISASVIPECDYLISLGKTAARYALCADIYSVTKDMLEANASVATAFNACLFEAGCPFLLLPANKFDFADMSKIAVAWNGRAEAARAIRMALPLLKNASTVNVVVVDPQEADVGEDPGNDTAVFMSRHDIKVTVDVLASGGRSTTEKLLQRVRDIDADLLVMGAYGHTKLREWLLGGATRDMLGTATVPVFMAH